MSRSPIVVLEFNELCPDLLNRLIGKGDLPHLKRLRDGSHVFTTDAEESGELLNPWVQWATVHTGLSAEQHGVETLSEGQRVAGKNVWDLLSEAGGKSWICGSMNASYTDNFRGQVLPDPWSTGIPPYPQERFNTYFKFIRSAVQEHSNEGSGITARSALQFLLYMVKRGLSATTIAAACQQLISERAANTRWRRAAIMDRLQLDLFASIWRSERPDLATFFLNSTAHLQHCYWRHFEPDAFSVRPSASEIKDFGGAIPFGYRAMDVLVGKILRLVGPKCNIVFCTALSQQPYLTFEEKGGRNYYRVRGSETLKQQFGLTMPYNFEPIMAEQFYVRFNSKDDTDKAESLLQSIRASLGGERSERDPPAFHLQRRQDALLVQCNVTTSVAQGARLWAPTRQDSIPFFDVFYHLDSLKSGCHHPDGVLWIRHPELAGKRHDGKVTIRSIAPTLLRLLGVESPPWMTSLPVDIFRNGTSRAIDRVSVPV